MYNHFLTSSDLSSGTDSIKHSYILLFFALFFTTSLRNVARSWSTHTEIIIVSHFQSSYLLHVQLNCCFVKLKLQSFSISTTCPQGGAVTEHYINRVCCQLTCSLSTHQSPEGSLLFSNDGRSTWSVVHEGQFSKTALIIILTHTAAHTILLYHNIIHTPVKTQQTYN